MNEKQKTKTNKDSLAVVILAAGKGTRMKSAMPKVMHSLCGRPMIEFVLDLVRTLKAQKNILVVGPEHTWAKPYIRKKYKLVVQKNLLGTADALRCTEKALSRFKGTILVLYADNPLLKPETVRQLLKQHKESCAAVTLLTAELEEPTGYGRVLRDKYNCVCKIVEEEQADEFQKEIKEINTGIMCFDKDNLFKFIGKLKRHPPKGEYYLTDMLELLYEKKAVVEALKIKDKEQALGVNTQEDLSYANKVIQKRILKQHMERGVKIIDPDSTFIHWNVKIGRHSVIYPFTVIENDVRIGIHCSVGPFCHLRQGVSIANHCVVGNFLEIVRSRIGEGTLAKHFSYIGDSFIGRKVNIGAGTVTANFDGSKKNITKIKDAAFIGSDTILVAPVEIGKGAKTGAGSVITKHTKVSAGSLVAGVPAKVLKRRKA